VIPPIWHSDKDKTKQIGKRPVIARVEVATRGMNEQWTGLLGQWKHCNVGYISFCICPNLQNAQHHK
jgi:hypothetical protein